jgi:hypothetical protein
MNARRSRLALIGVLALAVCVAVSLAAGAAEAKKGKKKRANAITISKIAPTQIPAGDGINGLAGVAAVPLTVGKKAKGKVVSPSSLSVTYQLTDPAANLNDIDIKVSAPGGRTVALDNPTLFFAAPGEGESVTTVGPLTQTADSAAGYCFPNPAPPPAGCPDGDPDNALAPPWAGTARLLPLANFSGVRAKGTWTVKALNFSTRDTHVLSSVSIHMKLIAKPAA